MQWIAPPITNDYFSSTSVPLIANQLQIIISIQTVDANINITHLSNTNILQSPKCLPQNKNIECLLLHQEFKYKIRIIRLIISGSLCCLGRLGAICSWKHLHRMLWKFYKIDTKYFSRSMLFQLILLLLVNECYEYRKLSQRQQNILQHLNNNLSRMIYHSLLLC